MEINSVTEVKPNINNAQEVVVSETPQEITRPVPSVEELNSIVSKYDIKFVIEADETVMQIVNTKTEEVIREIPNTEVRKLVDIAGILIDFKI